MSHRDSSPASSDDLKYARGVAARVPPSQRPLRPLEWVALAHVGILFVWITWGFGGGAEWMRTYLAWWGSLGFLITLTALQDKEAWREGWMKPLVWLIPFAAFNAYVVLATFNPSFQALKFENDVVFVHRGARAGLPSSARPESALQALWMFDALWISCFNLALLIRQRRALRGLLLLAAGNALALSVFGTIQKLAGAKGPYFGAVETRQPYFFSTFIYHNHWGAFTLLMLVVCIGLAWHYGRRYEARNFFHSPAFGSLIAIFFIAATVPLSGSRSSTLLAGLLFAVALGHWVYRMVRQRRRLRESVAPPLLGAGAAVVLGLAGIWWVARDTILVRSELTRTQVEAMINQGGIGDRVRLYGDTWRMAQAKPFFGWGMASYPHVFTLFNTQPPKIDRLVSFYRDAHSDWLQAFAEHGYVGATLLALCAVVPVLHLGPRRLRGALARYLLLGCGLLLLYAWVEFPFGNLAVVLAWWLCFFTALHYARLQDREAPTPTK